MGDHMQRRDRPLSVQFLCMLNGDHMVHALLLLSTQRKVTEYGELVTVKPIRPFRFLVFLNIVQLCNAFKARDNTFKGRDAFAFSMKSCFNF